MKFCSSCKAFVKFGHNCPAGIGASFKKEEDLLNFNLTSNKINSPEPLIFSNRSCSFCNSLTVVVTIKQLRGLDEAPTVFEKCHTCTLTKRND